MTARPATMTEAEARLDPAHRLWFVFVAAVSEARATATAEALKRADSAWQAFHADFAAGLDATPVTQPQPLPARWL